MVTDVTDTAFNLKAVIPVTCKLPAPPVNSTLTYDC